MKKQRHIYASLIIITSLLMIGSAQAATSSSSYKGVESLLPSVDFIRSSNGFLQLQTAEAARQNASVITTASHTYGIIKILNNIRNEPGPEANEAEKEMAVRSVIANTFFDYNTFEDLLIFYLSSRDQLPTRMAYLAISAWAYEARDLRPMDASAVDKIVSEYAPAFENHWVGNKEYMRSLFREQLIKFRDLSAKIYPEVAKHMKEKKEKLSYLAAPAAAAAAAAPPSIDSSEAYNIDYLPPYYQKILGILKTNLEDTRMPLYCPAVAAGAAPPSIDSSEAYDIEADKDAFFDVSHLMTHMRNATYFSFRRGTREKTPEIVSTGYYKITKKYGLSAFQSYDLASVLFLQAKAIWSTSNNKTQYADRVNYFRDILRLLRTCLNGFKN
jgi:hypothetical protein